MSPLAQIWVDTFKVCACSTPLPWPQKDGASPASGLGLARPPIYGPRIHKVIGMTLQAHREDTTRSWGGHYKVIGRTLQGHGEDTTRS